MSNAKIEKLLESLRVEVVNSELDEETTDHLRKFEKEIEPFLAAGDKNSSEFDTILDKAKKLEINFAQRHPTAEGIMREIVDTLVNMGI